jgi:menaquinone-dependent protoporphyrinogen oxidase
MSILVTYATKYGSTQGIAERMAATLKAQGLSVELRPIKAARDVAGYEAFVIGSAAHFGSWLKEASAFVEANQATLASKPVWLFSSGPLGTSRTDAQGRDVLIISEPKEFAAFKESLKPRRAGVWEWVCSATLLTLVAWAVALFVLAAGAVVRGRTSRP